MPHINQLIDYTVGVFIVHKDKVLIRKHDKFGIWLAVGGHVELNEDPIQAAIRESKEEVGLDITIAPTSDHETVASLADYHGFQSTELIPPRFLNRHSITDTHQHIDLVYFARSNSDTIIPEKPTDLCLWMTKAEVEQHPDIAPRIKYYALNALRELS